MEIISYFIYLVTVILASVFAFLAQKFSYKDDFGKVKPNSLFTFLSMTILIFVLGFRNYLTVGVDGYNYYLGYQEANSTNIISYYQDSVTEPGFYLLYRLSYALGDAQWLFILSAIITIFFFYKALSYEIDKLNFALIVFIFSTTQYFYYFGITRMGIAVAIVAFAYRYIITSNKRKFVSFVLIATMFHYSALFSLFLLLLNKNERGIFKKNSIVKIMIAIPFGFLLFNYLAFPYITASRYESYAETSGLINWGFITSVPLLLLFLIYYNKFSRINKNYQFYLFLFIAKIIAEMFSPLLGISRMVWFLNLSICFLFPAIIKLTNDKNLKLLLWLLTIFYCLTYSFYAYFGDSARGETMIPYEFLNGFINN